MRPWTREMPVVIGSVQPVQPVQPFRQILIIGVDAAAQCRRGRCAFLVVSFYLIEFLVGHPGQVGRLQQNQALLASNLRSVPWTGWTDLVPYQCNVYRHNHSLRLEFADHAPSPTAAS